MENGVLKVELPYKKSEYTLDIDVKGICNVSSGGTGTNSFKLKSDTCVIKVNFD